MEAHIPAILMSDFRNAGMMAVDAASRMVGRADDQSTRKVTLITAVMSLSMELVS